MTAVATTLSCFKTFESHGWLSRAAWMQKRVLKHDKVVATAVIAIAHHPQPARDDLEREQLHH